MAVTHKICTQMVRSASRFGGNGKGFPMIWFNAVAASPPFKKSLVITLQRWLQPTLQNSHVRRCSNSKESSNQQNTSEGRNNSLKKSWMERGYCCSYLGFQVFVKRDTSHFFLCFVLYNVTERDLTLHWSLRAFHLHDCGLCVRQCCHWLSIYRTSNGVKGH